MSPTGTDIQRGSRSRVGKTRRRTLATLAVIGAVAAIPVTVNAVGPNGEVLRGEVVVPSKTTPSEVKKALAGNGPVVVAFLLPGITEDEIVHTRLQRLKKESKFRDTTFVTYRITGKTKLGDLPTKFNVKYTPAVAVIRGDDKLSNVWRGLVDEDIIAQSLIDARNAVPKPAADGAFGNPAGMALARKVNAAYAKVAGVSWVDGSTTREIRLSKGLVDGVKVTVGGKLQSAYTANAGFAKNAKASCFAALTVTEGAAFVPGSPFIKMKDMRFGKPVKAGKNTQLVQSGSFGGKSVLTYTINAKNQVVAVKVTKAGSKKASNVTVASLAKAPVIPAKAPKAC